MTNGIKVPSSFSSGVSVQRQQKIRRVSQVLLFLLFFIYVLFPLYFKFSPRLQRHIIFVHDGDVSHIDFSKPGKYGLPGTQNLYLQNEDNASIGVWQILPQEWVGSAPSYSAGYENWYLRKLADGMPVFVYCHGNNPSRATPHRVKVYDVLRKLGFHVIAFDYRGYADSSRIDPTEAGVVQDARFVVHWVREHTQAPLFVWGHSLGAGICTHLVSLFCMDGKCPDGLVLQSPFTSIFDELHQLGLIKSFTFLPWFDYMFTEPVIAQNIAFNNSYHIQHVTCSLLILHADDDMIIPAKLGRQLYEIARNTRPQGSPGVRLVTFASELGYGHNYICNAPELPDLIMDFVRDSIHQH